MQETTYKHDLQEKAYYVVKDLMPYIKYKYDNYNSEDMESGLIFESIRVVEDYLKGDYPNYDFEKFCRLRLLQRSMRIAKELGTHQPVEDDYLEPKETKVSEQWGYSVNPTEMSAIVRIDVDNYLNKLNDRDREIYLSVEAGKSKRDIAKQFSIAKENIDKVYFPIAGKVDQIIYGG